VGRINVQKMLKYCFDFINILATCTFSNFILNWWKLLLFYYHYNPKM